jgi:hypothetical protein
MIRFITTFRNLFTLAALAICLSCTPRSAPVQESVLAGKWQQAGKPAISMTFLKDGTFRADVAGQRLMGGKFRLINGKQIILDLDASSPKTGLVTNRISLAGEELRITSAAGQTERYKRVE